MVGAQPYHDVRKYIRWADPTICSAADEQRLREGLVKPEDLSVVVIEGVCPEGEQYGTVTC
jgi:hypothetical protein